MSNSASCPVFSLFNVRQARYLEYKSQAQMEAEASTSTTDNDILQLVERQSRYKNTSGQMLLERLQAVGNIACDSLWRFMLNPDENSLKLSRHFRSPLALKQHVQAIITSIKYLGKRIPNGCLQAWRQILKNVSTRCDLAQKSVEQAFPQVTDATPKTIAGYINHLMNMSASLNVENFMDILLNPSVYRVELERRCKSPYTESTYITALLSVFKYNMQLKALHNDAFAAWSRACAEHRARHLKNARQNAPVSSQQSKNFVPMPEWRERLSKLMAEPDVHGTLERSMTVVFLTYACCMPVKRADVGTIHIFDTHPCSQELDVWPNYIVMDQAMMHIGKHKTSKHEVHSAGITEALPHELMQALRESLGRWPRVHLFMDAKRQAYTTQGFSKWVRRTTARLFGDKAPGVNSLRHSFCTSLDYNSLTCAERDDIALRCGHSSTMQDQYRYLSLDPVRQGGK